MRHISVARPGAIGEPRLVTSTNMLERALNQPEGGFVSGLSPAMRSLESVISEIASTNIPVLLIGESGTGKEMYAQLVHRLSDNHDKPLARISCGAAEASSFLTELGLNPSGRNGAAKTEFGSVFFDEISERNTVDEINGVEHIPF